ncbi:hypothetical protein FOL47_005454 [Perkinsus chesapeaki]|uniref:Uncharacterized protein n=1 Tax=Perkinsus chesapeaki TaxID=330153 RepID=A0A7J6LXG3_PERCH|nr:hypothetical protein FOL47_005454 [Perkinsus chesapeaki]
MQFIRDILLITAFGCSIAVELTVTSVSEDVNVRGDCYEKPTGRCDSEGKGCSCTPPNHLFGTKRHSTGKYAYFVCAAKCENAGDCPKPIRGGAVCIEKSCALGCLSDSDCYQGGVCVITSTSSACTFPINENQGGS